VPEDPNIYFHRIGRTARALGEGKAISLVSNDRVSDFERILAQTKLPIRKLNDELGIVVPVIAQRQASFGRGGGYRWRGGYGSRNGYRNERGGGGGGGQRRYGSGGGSRGGYGGYGHSRSQTGYGRDRRRSRYGYSGSSSSNNNNYNY
jgi:ATP-dependent RNA helicase DeaD